MASIKLKSTVPKPLKLEQARKTYRRSLKKFKKRVKAEEATKNLRNVIWDNFHEMLELAESEETYQQQFLYDPNSTLTDFVDTFKITRPIPLVEDG